MPNSRLHTRTLAAGRGFVRAEEFDYPLSDSACLLLPLADASNAPIIARILMERIHSALTRIQRASRDRTYLARRTRRDFETKLLQHRAEALLHL